MKKESLYFKINGKNIAELAEMDISDLYAWLNELPQHLAANENKVAAEILKEITTRVKFLLEVGLDYLSLNRQSAELSGGESQRIRLATQIGSQLVNVLYILDEPSIGLHQRDNARLIASLKQLRDLGNTVIVVEHDRDMMLSADYLIDIGPAAGRNGGEVVYQGEVSGFQVPGSKVQGSKFKVQGSKFKVQGSKFKVQGSKFKVQGSSEPQNLSSPTGGGREGASLNREPLTLNSSSSPTGGGRERASLNLEPLT